MRLFKRKKPARKSLIASQKKLLSLFSERDFHATKDPTHILQTYGVHPSDPFIYRKNPNYDEALKIVVSDLDALEQRRLIKKPSGHYEITRKGLRTNKRQIRRNNLEGTIASFFIGIFVISFFISGDFSNFTGYSIFNLSKSLNFFRIMGFVSLVIGVFFFYKYLK